MTCRPLRNVGASVRARLMQRSRETGDDFQLLLQRYGAERFLFRLGESPYRERFVLKGAMLLALWGEAAYRPTRDLDFTGYGSSRPDDVRSVICDICAISVADDGIEFHCEALTIDPIHGQDDYDGLRVRFGATLAKARVPMQIDIGFGDAIHPSPTDAHYPVLLGGSRPQIRVYPREAVVAEKLHAMVLHGERNSRYKDFYDFHVLSQPFAFDGECLVRAIRATFEQRGTSIAEVRPVALTPQFYADSGRAGQWRRYLERNYLPRAPSGFGIVGERILSFLVEPWDAITREPAFTGTWPEGGPWRH